MPRNINKHNDTYHGIYESQLALVSTTARGRIFSARFIKITKVAKGLTIMAILMIRSTRIDIRGTQMEIRIAMITNQETGSLTTKTSQDGVALDVELVTTTGRGI